MGRLGRSGGDRRGLGRVGGGGDGGVGCTGGIRGLGGEARVESQVGHRRIGQPCIAHVDLVTRYAVPAGLAAAQEARQRRRREQGQGGDTACTRHRHRRAPARRRAPQLGVHERLAEELGPRQIPLGAQMEQLGRAAGGAAAPRERALERLLPQRRAGKVTCCVHQLLLLREPAELADGLAHCATPHWWRRFAPAPRETSGRFGSSVRRPRMVGDSASMSYGVGAEAPIPASSRSCIASCSA
jgi:hypothetical protein